MPKTVPTRMKTKGKATSNALDIMKRRYYSKESRLADLEETRITAEAARLVYTLRTEAQLSQKELASMVGTTQSVISRLEDDDYEGHSLSMLSRIATALNKRLILRAE